MSRILGREEGGTLDDVEVSRREERRAKGVNGRSSEELKSGGPRCEEPRGQEI